LQPTGTKKNQIETKVRQSGKLSKILSTTWEVTWAVFLIKNNIKG